MAIILRGLLRPNEPYVQHAHGDIIIKGPRTFSVDDEATSDQGADVEIKQKVILGRNDKGEEISRMDGTGRYEDHSGDPLVLTVKTWEEIRAKLGKVLVCEPVGGLDGAGSAKRIMELEAKVAELEAQLVARQKKAAA